MRHVAAFGRWTFGLALALYLGIHLVKGQKPTGRAVDVVIYAVMAAALVVWALSAEPLRRKRRTLRATRHGENIGLELVPPVAPIKTRRKIRRRARRASEGILRLLADYRINDPTRDPWWYPYPNWNSLPDNEKTRIFNEHGSKSAAHMDQLMTRYQVDFSVEALWLYDEFARRGRGGDAQRHTFEHPVNTFCLEEIAQHLGVWARQL